MYKRRVAHLPFAVALNLAALKLTLDEGLNRIVVPSAYARRTSIVGGATNALVAAVPSGQFTFGVGLDRVTHRAHVANQLNFVQRIDVGGAALEATKVTAAQAGGGVLNPNNNLFYVARTAASTDMPFFDKSGAGGVVAGLAHGDGGYPFMARNATANRV